MKNESAETVMRVYREELEKLIGFELASKTRIQYYKGWFTIVRALQCPDGSISCPVSFNPPKYRKRQVIDMLNDLRIQLELRDQRRRK